MPIFGIDKGYRNIKRFTQILAVFGGYGFRDIVDSLHLEYLVRIGRRFAKKEAKLERLTKPERLRLAFEELGPTFIKFGQILSTRPDLIPHEYIEEFKKLQDEVPPFSFEEVRDVIDDEFKRPINELFDKIDEKPLAAASIAQVHRATLKDGDKVVLKIQRPNIRENIEADIDILFNLARLIESYIPESKLYNPTGIVQEFAKTIRREMDFTREGHNVNRFIANFKDDPTITAPKVYWELTTNKILTMEYVEGIKITDFDRLERAGLDKKQIAINGSRAVLKQIFDYGFFQGDPHPGNFLVKEDNVIAVLDFGMFGRIDEKTKEQIADVLVAVINKDADKIAKTFLEVGVIAEEVNIREFRLDIVDFLDRYYDVPLSQLNLTEVLNEIIQIVARHRIKVMPEVMLLVKALITIEGIGRELDPDFNMVEHARPFAEKLVKERVSPRNIIRGIGKMTQEVNELLRVLPSETLQIVRKLRKGTLEIDLKLRHLEALIAKLDRVSNRITFSIIIAAIIVGSSLIIQTDKGPIFFGFPALGIIGFVVAGALGLWLIYAILRSGRL
ncbi:MAG: 2-polyprenylphenol 6-hydroxylase [Nitrospirota bacterium]|jgi:ubiquinone biosynthesis protein